MTQRLMLLRHAKAVTWEPGCDDFSRVLAEKGQRHMQKLAAWMTDNVAVPERVLCSTAARTVETLAPLLRAWGDDAPAVSYLDSLYHASTGQIHHLATEALAGADSALLVGHNPGFESLSLGLMSDADYRRHQRMATGTLGVFDFAAGFDGGEHDGRLAHWVTRKDL
ncbi:hypothetical protein F3N42_08000 [Marinihelvus fidelis]|uniref:Histidine phosphatase family protein n=1 Tax=Marinihelvus fidelis TaxID=2613842 RepID=A0A5N0T920_9GAMM|nr:histidine phosphatase family protein [Marinihelvus fidelis]KAA9131261.1 hypothetical protein F3N42_08000 [Marinihelvus fidelis]